MPKYLVSVLEYVHGIYLLTCPQCLGPAWPKLLELSILGLPVGRYICDTASLLVYIGAAYLYPFRQVWLHGSGASASSPCPSLTVVVTVEGGQLLTSSLPSWPFCSWLSCTG